MPIIRDAAAVAAHDQQVVKVLGTYGITDTGRHKIAYTRADGSTGMTNKFVRLNLDGGAWVDLGVRPTDEMAALKGKAVVATGKLIAKPARKPGPGAAPDPAPTLVEIESVVEQAP